MLPIARPAGTWAAEGQTIRLRGGGLLNPFAQSDGIQALDRLLTMALGRRPDVRRYDVLKDAEDYFVGSLTVEHADLPLMVKLAGPNASLACPFDRTLALSRMIRSRTTVPTFEVLAADTTYREFPWRYLVYWGAPGTAWMDVAPRLGRDQLSVLYADLGEALAHLHGLGFPAFGELTAGGGVVGTGDYVQALSERARRRIARSDHADLFSAVLHERRRLFSDVTRACLAHEDLNHSNLLVAERKGEWHLSAIIDLDSAWAGGQESDLARLELWRAMAGERLFAAYRSVRAIPDGYSARRPVYQLLWCLEAAFPDEQHRRDTAAVCRQLDLAPVTFA